MATIVEMINPLTGLPEQVDKLDHTAQEIDDAVGLAPQLSNPNLLDNWYFGNPVNQRGQTSYTGVGYGIDRWIRNGGGDTLLNDGYITLLGYGNNLDQITDTAVYKQLRGKIVTISVLGRGYFSIVAEDYANSYKAKYVNSVEFTIGSLALTVRSDADRLIFHIQPQDGNPCDIIAVKLELGSQQTLAHQDANGNWVLNEIPDYGEQLRRCQRYFQTFATQSLRPTDALDFRPVMRTTPALSTITVGTKTLYAASADL